MIKKLAKAGLLTHSPYQGVALTEAGRRVALEMIRHDAAHVLAEAVQGLFTRLNGGTSTGLPAGWEWSLPTEAQWEYACRAGTTTATAFGDTLTATQANFDGNYPYVTTQKGTYLEKTSSVGSYEPNGWGLKDMHGNVYEWCLDSWDGTTTLPGGTDPVGRSGSYRVPRGGSWYYVGLYCRSASRNWGDPGYVIIYLGFRLAAVPVE
jgi:formylglycine-generating enzyme required for sulfatase activity